MTAVPLDNTGSLSWGHTMALDRAEGDPGGAGGTPPVAPWTFTKPDGTLAQWVAFRPDGIPRGFDAAPFDAGDVGSGPGAVYVTSGERDYAIVLAPLGGVSVATWNPALGGWRQ